MSLPARLRHLSRRKARFLPSPERCEERLLLAASLADGALFAPALVTQAPAASTLAASGLTGSSATLNASVNPQSSATTVDFVYGTDPTLSVGTTTTSAQDIGSGTTLVSVSAPLAGLVPLTNYYFQVVATSSGGTTSGAIVGFTTLALPTATTQAATLLTGTGATLNASVNPNGTSTDTSFQYSTVSNLGSLVSTVAGLSGQAGSANGSGGVARFSLPGGVAVDKTGNVYVADTYNGVIRKITPAGLVSTFAGTAGQYGSLDGNGPAARFNHPVGLALDGLSNLYVADSFNDTIRMISPTGVVTTIAGTPGQQGSADGTGAAAQFSHPAGLAVDGNGDVFVADKLNNTIREIAPGGVVTTIAGTTGVAGSADGIGVKATFNSPSGVAVDGAGKVYVADTLNDTIRTITPAGVVATLAGAPGQSGSADGTGAAAGFTNPTGVALDGLGNLVVADTYNQTIRVVAPGGVVTTLAGSGRQQGSVDGNGDLARFSLPSGVAVDKSGLVFVADTANDTIRMVSSPTQTIAASSGVIGTDPVPVNAVVAGLKPGTIYFERSVATSAAGTTLGAILSFTTPAPPLTTIQSATAITGTGAILDASVNPLGNATTVSFVYSIDSTLTTGTVTTPPLSIGAGVTPVAVSTGIAGLAPGTNYFFEALATSTGGTTTSGILSLTTAVLPTVVTGTASAVTGTSATLPASVNPQSSPTSVTFIVGTDPSLTIGTFTTLAQSAGNGTTAQDVSTALIGLSPGTNYYYQAVGTSIAGSTVGAILSFSTASPALSVSSSAPGGVVLAGQAVTFTASVSAAGAPVSVGTVFFVEGGTPLSGPVSLDANGHAFFTTFNLPASAGPHVITAVYVSPSQSATVAASTNVVVKPLVVDGPRIVNVEGFLPRRGHSSLVLTFNRPLDPTRARNAGLYVLTNARGGRIGFVAAVYDPNRLTVTLQPRQRLNVNSRYTLTVLGTAPNGLTDAQGLSLDGNGNGHAGSNYVTAVDRNNLLVVGVTGRNIKRR